MAKQEKKVTGYDKYVDWKLFSIPLVLLFVILIIPMPYGMKDVGTEYRIGPKAVISHITQALFGTSQSDALQWQLLCAQIMERNMNMGALSRERYLKRDLKWCKSNKINTDQVNFDKARTFIDTQQTDTAYRQLMQNALTLRKEGLKYEELSDKDRKAADVGAWHIKVAIAMTVFVVLCFLTECIPLPGVAFCIGLMLVFTGVTTRKEVAMLYWDDACWFIMGSLMFAAAFVKTGVDKRVCLMMFRKLAVPNVRWITLIFFVIITPLAAFISDHALAAMFLPIGMLLYQNSLTKEVPSDPELGKMLMIAIAMACNVGGPGAPSGGARNVIMMTYLADMFGMDIGYFQWITYCFPFLLFMIPTTWLMVNWRFKPAITSLKPAMAHLQNEISRMGGWNRKQIIALIIFGLMVFGWFTEKEFYNLGIYPVRLGIGVIAVAGAVGYLLFWGGQLAGLPGEGRLGGSLALCRCHHFRAHPGQYRGRILAGPQRPGRFGASGDGCRGLPLMAVSNGLTAVITNLMADGPAAAAVGPITLNMAGLVHPGSAYLPFMAMATGHLLVLCLLSHHRHAAQRHCIRQRLPGAQGLPAGRPAHMDHRQHRTVIGVRRILELQGIRRFAGVLK